MKRGVELWAVVGLAAWLALFWRGPLINDVGWQLWVARQLNAGSELYADILEVNPPLWFWMNAPVERVGEATGLGGLGTLLLAFAACAAVTIWLCSRLVEASRERALLYASLVATLFLTSPFALGQREQFAWIVAVPYLALIARRAEGRPVAAGLALAVGLWAASGFALKHYFALVPIALEAWLWWRTRRARIRPELVGLALAAAAYAVAVLLLTPEYLGTMVPLLRLAYGGYDEPLLAQLRQPALFAAAFAIVALTMRRLPVPMLAQAAAVAAGTFALIYLLQGKAFHYHAIPALGAALLALLVGFGCAPLSRSGSASLVAAALALGAAAVTPLLAGPARFDHPARAVTASLPAGTPVVMISASGVAAWPTVYERELGWPSRHMTLWMLPSVWLAERDGDPSAELARLATRVRREVADEIACSGAPLVLVDSRYDAIVREGDLLAFMARDPAFARAMLEYGRASDAGYLRVYRRQGPARGRECSGRQFAI
jgi:hypothetical protein